MGKLTEPAGKLQKPLWKSLQLIDYVLPSSDSVSSLVLSLGIIESPSLEVFLAGWRNHEITSDPH